MQKNSASGFEAISHSVAETFEIGQRVAQMMRPGLPLLLTGDLGAGKTTLVKGIIHSLTGVDPQFICSPTYTYLHLYPHDNPFCAHFDLYRLSCFEDFQALGFCDYLFAPWMTCIEWPERVPEITGQLLIMEHLTSCERRIRVL